MISEKILVIGGNLVGKLKLNFRQREIFLIITWKSLLKVDLVSLASGLRN